MENLIDRFPILSWMDKDTQSKLKMVAVCGRSGCEAVVVTDDDDVYSIGGRTVIDRTITEQPALLASNGLMRKLDDLVADSSIKDMAFSGGTHHHVLACTNTGRLYSWGQNTNGKMGIDGQVSSSTPLEVWPANQAMFRVDKVACGENFSACLMSSGQIWTWGCNNKGQLGIGSLTSAPTPRRVVFHLVEITMKAIACGRNFALALSENGDLYSWGANESGQLGVGHGGIDPQMLPHKVSFMSSVVIDKMACGAAHVLAMTNDGTLYVWGSNDEGQLGTGARSDIFLPVALTISSVEKVGIKTNSPTELTIRERVVDIGAHHSSDLSVALTHRNHVFVWGSCRGLTILTPTKTNYKDLDTAFAACAEAPITFRPINFSDKDNGKLKPASLVIASLQEAFDDSTTADLKFILGSQTLYAHKAVLKIRSERFRRMFSDAANWKEVYNGEVHIETFTYDVFKAYLLFLYTGKVDIADPESATKLLELAQAYCEDELRGECIGIIRQGVSIENAACMYKQAINLGAKDLEETCFHLLVNDMTNAVRSGTIDQLDETCLKAFLKKAADVQAFRF